MEKLEISNNENLLPEKNISEYASVVFNTIESSDWAFVDLSDNLDLKKVLDKDWMEVVETILSSRLKLFSPKFKIDWNKIFILNKYWVDSDFLDKWINDILISDLNKTLKNIKLDPKPLLDAIKVIQDSIYKDNFIDSIFQNIVENWNLNFFNDIFKKRLEKLNHNLKIKIFNVDMNLLNAIKIINAAWNKFWKENLFRDFKNASILNISKIAEQKWLLKIKNYSKYSNKIVQDLIDVSLGYWIKDFDILSIDNFKSNNSNNLFILNSIDLTLDNFFDKKLHSIFIKGNSIDKKYLENLILKHSSYSKEDPIKYTTLLTKYKTFYLPIIRKINNGIKNKIKNFKLIEDAQKEIQKLKEDLDNLDDRKKEIEKDLSWIEKSWISNYNYKHKNKVSDDIWIKKYKIKKLKESIKISNSQIKKQIITESELKSLKDFIDIKNKLEYFIDN